MPTLQLRLSNSYTLQNLAGDIAIHVGRLFARHTECCGMQMADTALVEDILLRQLNQCVSRYTVCGQRTGCHSNLKKVPWRALDNLGRWVPYCSPDHPRILLLHIDESLPRFCLDIEGQLFDACCEKGATRCWLMLKQDLDRVMRNTLGPYLYENPACEDCPSCTAETLEDAWT